jgi:hypothetical protein
VSTLTRSRGVECWMCRFATETIDTTGATHHSAPLADEKGYSDWECGRYEIGVRIGTGKVVAVAACVQWWRVAQSGTTPGSMAAGRRSPFPHVRTGSICQTSALLWRIEGRTSVVTLGASRGPTHVRHSARPARALRAHCRSRGAFLPMPTSCFGH